MSLYPCSTPQELRSEVEATRAAVGLLFDKLKARMRTDAAFREDIERRTEANRRIVATCHCGLSWSALEWSLLPVVAGGRKCNCGSTMEAK